MLQKIISSRGTARVLSIAALSVAFLAPGVAQASEVVKLARLVITGKRAGTEATLPRGTEAQSVQQLPRVLVEGQRLQPEASYNPMAVLFGSRPVVKPI
ncbi:hypothetical protein [Paucibacter soli]|uniref:hypothetical protein n=1 Tax=Paucibacter soli TaxID=3133433 RepID=UPI0030AE8BEA